jgi:hypothetical protein
MLPLWMLMACQLNDGFDYNSNHLLRVKGVRTITEIFVPHPVSLRVGLPEFAQRPSKCKHGSKALPRNISRRPWKYIAYVQSRTDAI